MGALRQDLLYALRTLRRTPGFTAVAVITMGLAVGANTAIFSVVQTLILKPLPYRDPGRLISIWDTYLPQFRKIGISPVEIEAWSRQSDLFEQSAWYRYVPKNLNMAQPGREAIEVHATCAPDRLFTLLGVRPALGRTFAQSEPPDSMILSYKLWESRFGSDPEVVGKTVAIDEKPFHVIGVMPEHFSLPEWAEMWLTPAQMGDEITNPVRHAAGFVARLRPGVTLEQASARVQSIARRLASEHPKTSRGWGMTMMTLQDDVTASFRPALLMLFGAVTLVLLIACANISNLLLARASGRTREIAIRAALGSGAWRIVRQLVTESVVLAMIGGTLGLFAGRWTLTALSPQPASLNIAVLLFVLAVSLAAGVVMGLAPAFHALRSELTTVIKSASAAPGGSPRVRGAFVVAEIALSLILVAGAGILAKSLLRLLHVDPGFNPHGVLTMRLTVPPSRNPDVVFHRIQASLAQLPGVESVAATNALPLIADRANTSRFNVPGSPLINPDALPAAQLRTASPDFFRTMQIPLRAGRTFTERDMNKDVVIINETMARRFWPGRDPVGLKFITGPWGPNPTWSEIVGVVADVKQFGLDSEPSLDIYHPSLAPQILVIRSSGDPLPLAAPVRRAITAIDQEAPISDIRTMDQVMRTSTRSRRWTMGLLSGFAGLALVLALVGIYGVLSWSVSQRTREIGIRMAIGAEREDVMGLIVRDAMKLTAAGLAIGVAGALALRQVLASLVFDVSTADPLIYVGSAAMMLAAVLLACYVPMRRATRVDPLVALRWE